LIPLRSDGSHDGQEGGLTALTVAKLVKLKNYSRKPMDLTKSRYSDSLKSSQKSQLTLYQGMMKKGDIIVVADDDDDEVRSSVLQNQSICI
jgi:hypothetical protein